MLRTAAALLGYTFTETTQEINEESTSEKIKYFWPDAFESNQENHDWLLNKKFKSEQYTKIIFTGFDFTQSKSLSDILNYLSPEFIFVQAIFTPEQIQKMLFDHVDISRFSYKMIGSIQYVVYRDLHTLYAERGQLEKLRGLPVYYGQLDLRGDPSEDIMGVCYPSDFSETNLTEKQLAFLLKNRNKTKPLDLSGLLLDGIDIRQIIKQYHNEITFDADFDKIILKNTQLMHAIVSIETLAFFAEHEKYHNWFNTPDLTFTIRLDDSGLENIDVKVNVNEFISTFTLPNATPRLHATSFFDVLKVDIKKLRPDSPEPDFNALQNGEKLLWVFYCAYHLPKNAVRRKVSELLGIKGYWEPQTARPAQATP